MTATFRVWAPAAQAVVVQTVGSRHPMTRAEAPGWWEAEVPAAGPGDDYAFVLDDGPPRPDPRSAWQPAGVHAASRLVDHDAFGWTDQQWQGRPLCGGVIYELHVGTFTPAGTFDGVIGKLDHVIELGADFVELMPVHAFPGRHGWGYDGVALHAVHDAYGGPDGLKRLVDACHTRGLGVILDVVYNHLGPNGNYLPEFGPYFIDGEETPWGATVNLDADGADEARAFFIDNAVQWLRDYHVDGLRLDAVHALTDNSPRHFLAELADTVARLSDDVGRPLFLVAESDDNDPRVVAAREDGGHGMNAQWSDDFHHALHAALTGEQAGYYADFGKLEHLATALTEGFVYTGQHSAYRGKAHGAPLPPKTSGHRLVGYAQNHDQIGNRAQGERASALLSSGALHVAAALTLTAPFTPLLFMGEEWGATTPWQYFTDHDRATFAASVRDGRRAEFASFGWDPATIPDPQDPATFERSRLDWSEPAHDPHHRLLEWYRSLIRLRRQWPELGEGRLDEVDVAYDEAARWIVVRRGHIAVACNLAEQQQQLPLPGPAVQSLLASEPVVDLGPETVTAAPESVVVVELG